ncbi:MAG: Fe-S cluster assembly sulfur transfer protein SufU [Myxococcota bacterium]
MSDELRELYQSVILDHNKRPRNFGAPEDANRHAEGHNPLCGDQLTIHVTLADGVVQDVGFEGQGCAISKASASLMTEAVKGMPADEAEQLFTAFHDLVTSDPRSEPEDEGLGKLAVFGGVREFPMRVKCATLCWHTLRSALSDGDVVTTE